MVILHGILMVILIVIYGDLMGYVSFPWVLMVILMVIYGDLMGFYGDFPWDFDGDFNCNLWWFNGFYVGFPWDCDGDFNVNLWWFNEFF